MVCIEVIYSTKHHRFEPFALFKSRNNFTHSLFSSLTKYLTLSDVPPYKCIVKKKIDAHITDIFTYDKTSFISSDYYLPFKSNISSLLLNELELHLNTTNKFILALNVLFELKNNITQTFITLKRTKNDTEIELYRNFLRERINNKFIVNYIHNMPLSSHLNQMSWTSSHFEEYKISGMYSPKTNFVKMVYNDLIINGNKREDDLFSQWLNSANTNLFLSIYQFIDSKGFILKNDVYYIFPFIDICGFSYDKKKKIYVEEEKSNTKYNIKSFSSYQVGEEFKFPYSYDLSNDNLILNYGFIDFNNTEHSYIFHFEIDDYKLKFYRFINWKKFNMNLVKIQDSDQISATFPLSFEYINSDLLQFVFLYSEFVNENVKVKYNKSLMKKYSAYFLYYSTIYKNVLTIIDLIPNEKNLMKYIGELGNLERKIDELDSEISKLNDKGIIDNFENLYFYNQLHETLNQKNIMLFNLENLNILFKHENYVYDEIIKNQWEIINSGAIKGKYVK